MTTATFGVGTHTSAFISPAVAFRAGEFPRKRLRLARIPQLTDRLDTEKGG